MSTDNSKIRPTPSVSGGVCAHGKVFNCPTCDAEELYDEEDEQCPYCDYNPSIHGYTSHYHCGRCGEESSMMGHYRQLDIVDDGVPIKWRGFTCDPNNERASIKWDDEEDWWTED